MQETKILILTCNTGGGHNSVAGALKESFEAKGAVCDIEDGLSFISKGTSKFISRWHTRIYRRLPNVFRTGYAFADRTINDDGEEKSLVYRYIGMGARKLRKRILRGGYSFVVCVHVIPALMLTAMKEKFSVDIKSCFVATDYTCSPLVNECNVDFFAIPTDDLADEFVSCGIPKDRLITTGIPIRSVFYGKHDKNTALKELGLPEDSRHILLMSGSIGCGPMKNIARQLDRMLPEDVNISVICGRNRRMYTSLLLYPFRRVNAIGFTRDIHTFMESADLMVTKPGGISVTEAAANGTPMLLLDIVGGCETHNINYFKEKGWAYGCVPKEAAGKICALLEYPTALSEIAEKTKSDFSVSAADKLCEVALEMCE